MNQAPITLEKETITSLKHQAEQLDFAAQQISSVFSSFDATSDERKSLKLARVRCMRAKTAITTALTVKKGVVLSPTIDDVDETG